MCAGGRPPGVSGPRAGGGCPARGGAKVLEGGIPGALPRTVAAAAGLTVTPDAARIALSNPRAALAQEKVGAAQAAAAVRAQRLPRVAT